MTQTDSAMASRLMIDFDERTGIASDAPPNRYLWTDAFAVPNALDLSRETGEARWRDLFVALTSHAGRARGTREVC